MKNLRVVLGLLVMTALFFSSCDKDDDPVDQFPTIEFKADNINSDTIVTVGSEFTIGITAFSNETSKSELQDLMISRTANNTMNWDTTITIGSDAFNGDFIFMAMNEAGVEKIDFTVTDKKGETAKLSVNITTQEDVNVTYYPEFNLGSWGEADPSFFDAETGTSYATADAGNNQGLIDFGYFRGASTSNTIAAPSSANIQSVYNLNWGTYNNTVIAMAGISDTEFDAIGTNYEWPEVTETTDEINQLTIGSVLVFKTVDGKVGFIKVKDLSITKSGEGVASLEVKIQS